MEQLDLFGATITAPANANGKIDQMEFAVLFDKCSKPADYVYGTYEECEEYANTHGLYADRYLDHVNPSTVQKNFKYVGQGTDPYELQRGFNYETGEKIVDNSF
jgi:hypothetical protein